MHSVEFFAEQNPQYICVGYACCARGSGPHFLINIESCCSMHSQWHSHCEWNDMAGSWFRKDWRTGVGLCCLRRNKRREISLQKVAGRHGYEINTWGDGIFALLVDSFLFFSLFFPYKVLFSTQNFNDGKGVACSIQWSPRAHRCCCAGTL